MRSLQDYCREARGRIREIECEEARAALEGGAPAVVLDVRGLDEIAGGLIPGAVLLPRGRLEKHAAEVLPDRAVPVFVCSGAGERGALAADVLTQMGYTNVANIKGGFERWRHLGFPVAKGAGPTACTAFVAELSRRAALPAPPPAVDFSCWTSIREDFAIATRRLAVGGAAERPLVYMDHAASTHPPETVLRSYVEFLEREYANVHRGSYALARQSTMRFEDAYKVCAEFIGGNLEDGCVVFTQNTTGALDLVAHLVSGRPGKVLVTDLEHHSNDLPYRRRNAVVRVHITPEGRLDMEDYARKLRSNDVKLVAVTGAANVTGWMPDIHTMARMAHEAGALIAVDGAQLLAHAPVDVLPADHPGHIDFFAAAGHKAYAPFGAGFLYGPRSVMDEAAAYIPGGGTAANVTPTGVEYLRAPDRHQGGTPNIPGVIAMASALRFLRSVGMERVREHEMALMRRAWEGMRAIEGVTLYGPPDIAERVGIIPFNIAGVSDMLGAAIFGEEGAVAVRNGRFCAHVHADKLLRTQGGFTQEGDHAPGAIRASLGLYNTAAEVDWFLQMTRRIRDQKWIGRYKVKKGAVAADWGGRCADRWMEGMAPAPAAELLPASDEDRILIEQLNGEGAECLTWLVANRKTGDAMIVDPVRDKVPTYIDRLRKENLTLRYTVETHTHADHLSGSRALKDLTGARMLMSPSATAPCVDVHVAEGEGWSLGDLPVEVLETPGHTEDSMCLRVGDHVFTGDLLLVGGAGRTDLPGGDAGSCWRSLERLKRLPLHTRVHPAHSYGGGPLSTIGAEIARNPALRYADAAAFIAEAEQGLTPPPWDIDETLAANRACAF
jgi:selenocysteine lyase/cysteine desulfurase/glyoxylase-like metal-dependent hydrolase (beta-lactamase superfamily II)/rhodanese-related sulfurtransferase